MEIPREPLRQHVDVVPILETQLLHTVPRLSWDELVDIDLHADLVADRRAGLAPHGDEDPGLTEQMHRGRHFDRERRVPTDPRVVARIHVHLHDLELHRVVDIRPALRGGGSWEGEGGEDSQNQEGGGRHMCCASRGWAEENISILLELLVLLKVIKGFILDTTNST